jgi:large subunit ribosomal protein L25
MERVTLQTTSRDVRGKQVKQLRTQNWIPAVVYGPDSASVPIQADERALSEALGAAGSTALIDLTIDDQPKALVVLAREVQRNILNGRLLHVDFYALRLTETVKTSPRVVIVGESPMAKAGLAVMLHTMNEVEVECLPIDLIDSIEVDVSSLETMDDTITVGQLLVPSTVTLLDDPEDVVVSLVPVRTMEEEELEEEEWEEVVDEEGEEVVEGEEEE